MGKFDMVRLCGWQSAMDDIDLAQGTIWNLGYDQDAHPGMHKVEVAERLWLACDDLRDAVEVLIDLVTLDQTAKNRLDDKWRAGVDSSVCDLLGPVQVLAAEASRVARRNGYIHDGNVGEGRAVAAATEVAIGSLPDVASMWVEDKTLALMEDAQERGWAGADVVLSAVATYSDDEFEEFYQELIGKFRGEAEVKLYRLVAQQVIRTGKES